MTAAVLDAYVFIPAPVSDTLLRAAQAGFHRVLWSDEIMEEARRNGVKIGLIDERELVHRTMAMRAVFPNATVTRHTPLAVYVHGGQGDRSRRDLGPLAWSCSRPPR